MAELLETVGLTHVELAAALNVTQSAVNQWINGVRVPSGAVRRSLVQASGASDKAAQYIDAGLNRGPIKIPVELWEPVFRPTSRFRLPLHLEWSGSEQSRWRDARVVDSLLAAYTQVIVEGSTADIVTWIDPKTLADNIDRVLWPRCYEAPWRAALKQWSLL